MRSAIILCITLIHCVCAFLIAQDSTRSSIGLSFKAVSIPPKFNPLLEITRPEQDAGKNWLPQIDMRNPFEIDTRSSSYYVPRQVRDELNLIMNRPRESAFMPVLGLAAFLAYQIAENVLFINMKTAIEADNLERARDQIQILELLWAKNPRTADELFARPEFQNYMTLKGLIDSLAILSENKLIRTRQEEVKIYYYPAIRRHAFIQKIKLFLSNPDLNQETRTNLENLLAKLNRYTLPYEE